MDLFIILYTYYIASNANSSASSVTEITLESVNTTLEKVYFAHFKWLDDNQMQAQFMFSNIDQKVQK